jgi:hypothetical protein
MEDGFGHDFSRVRVHDVTTGVRSPSDFGAAAYTVGNDIVLPRESSPSQSGASHRLLAHELVHVIQQQDNLASAFSNAALRVTQPTDQVEVEATQLADDLLRGQTIRVQRRSGLTVARDNIADNPPKRTAAPGAGGEGKMLPLIDEDLGRSTLVSTGSEEFRRNYVDANIQTVDYWSTPYADQEARFRDFWVNYSDGRRLQFSLDQIPVRYEIKQEPGTRRVRLTAESPSYVKRGGFIYPVFYGFGTVPRLIDIATTLEFNHRQRKKFLEVAELTFTFGVKILPMYAMPPEIPEGFIRRPPRLPSGLGRAAAGARETQVFVEIGAGDLKASIDLARKGEGAISVIAVDTVAPAATAVKDLEQAGGQFVEGVATNIKPGTADHVFQYFPWRIGGSGSHAAGGTWRVVEDTVTLLKPDGAAHFVTEDLQTAEFLAGEANARGLRTVITHTTAGAAAPGASGAGVPGFGKALEVWLVNVYK